MADRRVGFASAAGRTAWQVLFDRIMPSYVNESGTVVCARPSFEARYLNITYPDELLGVWRTLLDIDSDKREHLYDIVNVGRQVLGDFFAFERDGLHRAYLSQRSDSVDYYACRMDKMLDDLDRLLACSEEFSLRKWIEDARGFGATAAEKDYYERNARTLITVWGDSRQLTDYANRTWAGLVSSYYKQRWHIFTAHVRRAVRLKQPLDAKACDKEIEAFERRWIEPEITKIVFPKACKAVRQMAREIYDSWFGTARQAPLPRMSPPLE
nr:alpha-N-acetylglucosaminidase C-terminal domain-containing protein [Segatella maculosa]